MKKVVDFIKNNYLYLVVFIFVLTINIVGMLTLDEVWNYGFAVNIYRGLVPYKDFNMVIPPLYPFIMSIFFRLFSSNLLTMHIVNALMITHMYYIIKKLVKRNACIVFFFLCVPLSLLFPSYNLFLFYLFVLLLYFEKENFNDYIIGLLIAFLILTKHTVGIFFLIASVIVAFKDKGKLKKRLLACFLVLAIFLFYLLITKSFYQFIDLCVLGLFDFSKGNGKVFNFLFYFSLVLLGILLFFIKKHPRDFHYLYLLAFMANIIPLFDLYHVMMFLVASLIIFFMKKEVDFRVNVGLIIFITISILEITSLKDYFSKDSVYPNKIPNFEYRYLTNVAINNYEQINNKKKEYSNKKVIFISGDGYLYKLMNNEKIDKFDLINMGNYGYNGSRKLLNDIKKLNNGVFFVDKEELGIGKQTDQDLIKYILTNGKKIDKIAYYDIYTLGG